jgi:hypothetical protein
MEKQCLMVVENGFSSQSGYDRARIALEYEANSHSKENEDNNALHVRRKRLCTTMDVAVPQLPTLVVYKKQCEEIVKENPMANPETPLRMLCVLCGNVECIYNIIGDVIKEVLTKEIKKNNLVMREASMQASFHLVTWRDGFGVEGEGREKGMVRLLDTTKPAVLKLGFTSMLLICS